MSKGFNKQFLTSFLQTKPNMRENCPKVFVGDISEEDISEEDISEEDTSEEDFSEEDISEEISEDISEEDILWHSNIITDMSKTFTNFAKKVLRVSKYLLGLTSYIMTQIIEVMQY